MSAWARSSRRISRRSSAPGATRPWTARWWRRNSPRWPRRSPPRPVTGAARRRWRRGSCASRWPTWRTRSSRSRCRRATMPAHFALACFGGAGGQHACLVADALGMQTVFMHPFAGVLSAYGMGLADQTALREQAVEASARSRRRPRTARGGRPAGGRGHGDARRAGCRPGAGGDASQRACLLRRHRGDIGRAACRPRRHSRRLHRGASRPVRLRDAGTRADRGGGGGGGGRRRRAGGGSPPGRADRGRARGDRPRVAVQRRRRARCAGVRPRRPARRRRARRPGADPRGGRDHRGGTRLAGGDHPAGPHVAAPDRAAAGPDRRRHRPAGPGAARAVQQPVHERRGTDRRGAAEHRDEREHQGAAGFLLRRVRCRRAAGGQCAAHPGASGRDGGERAHRARAPARRA